MWSFSIEDYIPSERPFLVSAFVLVFANLSSILGILLLDWTVQDIVWIYALESVIIGIFNIPKMLFAAKEGESSAATNVFLTLFFLIHYNAFLIAEIFALFVFFIQEPTEEKIAEFDAWLLNDWFDGLLALMLSDNSVVWFMGALFASHLFSFIYHYLIRGEFREVSAMDLLTSPYNRIFVQILLVIAGGFVFTYLELPSLLLPVLIVLKIAVDLPAHVRAHRQVKAPTQN